MKKVGGQLRQVLRKGESNNNSRSLKSASPSVESLNGGGDLDGGSSNDIRGSNGSLVRCLLH